LLYRNKVIAPLDVVLDQQRLEPCLLQDGTDSRTIINTNAIKQLRFRNRPVRLILALNAAAVC